MRYELLKPVYFIGFMGAGKTTVSRVVAAECGLSAIDLDAFVEARAGCPVAQIFAYQGEPAFREMESRFLEELSIGTPRLMSTGGGAAMNAGNVRVMKRHGYVVYLGVSIEAAAKRIPDSSTRPLFQNPASAAELLERRIPVYESAADAYVNTEGRAPADVAQDVQRILIEDGVLVKLP